MVTTLRVEFHCHTIFSKDSLSPISDLLITADKRLIDRIVITDHNTIAGALEAKALAPEQVIVGEEIMTLEGGELLAAFVTEEVPPRLPAREAIAHLRDQGAFISVSHPFDRLRGGGWSRSSLLGIRDQIDAIEVFNARCFPPIYNRRALAFAEEHGLSGTVGSDAHTLYELGWATMRVPFFDDAASLRQVIPEAVFETRRSSLIVRLSSRYAVLHKRVTGRHTPT
jgi:predicted metal-dependent phosphoesterase TrpH